MFLGWNQRQAQDWQPIPYELVDYLSTEYGSFYCGDLLFLERLGQEIWVYGYKGSDKRVELASFAPGCVTVLHWPAYSCLRSGANFLLGSVEKEKAADYLYCPARPGLQIDYSGQVVNGPRLWPDHLSWKDVVREVSQTLWQAYYRLAKGVAFDSPALVSFYVSAVSRPDSAWVKANLTHFPGLKNAFVLESLQEALRPLPHRLGLQPQHLQDQEYLRVIVHPPTNLHEALLT